MDAVWIVGPVILGITLAIIIISSVMETKRAAAMAAAAAALKLNFQKKCGPDIIRELREFHLLQRGHSGRIMNLISGSAMNLDLRVFDYSYTISGGKSNTVVTQTVISFTSPELELPDFELAPETFLHRIGEAFGARDIDFAEHPGFSKHYRLRGADEAAVRTLFGRNIREAFEARPGFSMEGRDHTLLFYRRGKRIRPEVLKDFMAEGFEILKLFRE